jgi:iron complex transport system ATP-binding protein
LDSAIVELCDVSYRAGGQRILDRVAWRVERGEAWAVLGPNGAGKTVMLRIAAGFLWPNAGGLVKRCGQRLVDLRQLRRSIGWVSVSLLAEVPGRENVLDTVVSGHFAQVGLKPVAGDRPAADDYERAHDHLLRLGGAELARKPFGVLSQGEKQKVLLARARMADPLLIVLDEPCAGLDPGARERFLGTITALLEQPDAPGLVLVTHHIEEIVPGITHTAVMHQGRMASAGGTDAVLRPETISHVYGRPLRDLICRDGRRWPIW